MSAGSFSRSKYESDTGYIHPIRVQPETLALTLASTANSAPTGVISSGISARVSNGNRQLGLKPRHVVVAFTATPPAGYSEDRQIRLSVHSKSPI